MVQYRVWKCKVLPVVFPFTMWPQPTGSGIIKDHLPVDSTRLLKLTFLWDIARQNIVSYLRNTPWSGSGTNTWVRTRLGYCINDKVDSRKC